jgi:hypothetical protein
VSRGDKKFGERMASDLYYKREDTDASRPAHVLTDTPARATINNGEVSNFQEYLDTHA